MGQHAAGALVDDLEPAEHADEVAARPGGVGEAHPVERERRLVLTHERAVGEPRAQEGAGVVVAVGAAARHVDVDDVVLVASGEGVDVGVGQHVVGRREHGVEVDGRGVADRTERLEARHGVILAVPPSTEVVVDRTRCAGPVDRPTDTVPAPWTSSIPPRCCATSTA